MLLKVRSARLEFHAAEGVFSKAVVTGSTITIPANFTRFGNAATNFELGLAMLTELGEESSFCVKI